MAVAQASSTVGSATPKTERRPLPVEIIANVGVAVGGIEPQAAVQRERRIQLIDPLARIGDGGRNVRACRRLGQRQRWRAESRRDVATAAASHAEEGGFGPP